MDNKIKIDIDANLHLRYPNISKEEYSIENIKGEYVFSKDGQTTISFGGGKQRALPLIVVLIIGGILIMIPNTARIYSAKRKTWGLKSPENLVDLTGGEYSAKMRVNFSEKEYAFVNCSVEKVDDTNYNATIDILARYNSKMEDEISKSLPIDMMMTDGGPGLLIGHSILNLLNEDNSITRGYTELAVYMKDENKRLPMPQVFTFNPTKVDKDNNTIEATNEMIAVDCLPIDVEFDKQTRTYIG